MKKENWTSVLVLGDSSICHRIIEKMLTREIFWVETAEVQRSEEIRIFT